MNRGASDSGLVRRVKARDPEATAAASGSRENGSRSDEEDDQEGYTVDNDSKETRLTLMEEVLLLGLKEKEVSVDKFVVVIALELAWVAYIRLVA